MSLPATSERRRLCHPADGRGDLNDDFDRDPRAFKVATTVAAYAEILRESRFGRDIDGDQLVEIVDDVARELRERDLDEFADLVKAAYWIGGLIAFYAGGRAKPTRFFLLR